MDTKQKKRTLSTIIHICGIEDDIMNRFQIFSTLCHDCCKGEEIHGPITLFVPEDEGIDALLCASGIHTEDAHHIYRGHLNPHAYIVRGTIPEPPWTEETSSFTSLAGTNISLGDFTQIDISHKVNGISVITDPLYTLRTNVAEDPQSSATDDNHVTIYTIERPFRSYT